jgi:hypothetical protein
MKWIHQACRLKIQAKIRKECALADLKLTSQKVNQKSLLEGRKTGVPSGK